MRYSKLTLTNNKTKFKKNKKLRHNEYYNMQTTFDKLYIDSQNKRSFTNLMDIITSENNIKLAYRNIKGNKGSKTCGTNKKNILDIAETDIDKFVIIVRKWFNNYQPKPVRRVFIPKPNGKSRPLGIPTIEDRIIQQCILQVLEPICEAKFYKHSYGFRPCRSTHHALARSMYLINCTNLNYVVDVDIKGFFDNVNHSKLIKQIWALGIHDKNLISIINKILKSEIKGEGVPNKGTPQGGILSPILSNIVLNELDWWIANQWDNFPTKTKYKHSTTKNKFLKETNLKEMYIVRYADDFKIFTRNYKDAFKIYKAVQQWLKERLGLDISNEKSKVTNLRKNYTDFLGFKLKAVQKGKKYVANSHVSNPKKITTNIKNAIIKAQKHPTINNINKLNSTILGIHNYYKIASHVSCDFNKIGNTLNLTLKNRFKRDITESSYKSKTYLRYYGKYKHKVYNVMGITIYPIKGISNKPPMNLNQNTTPYTKNGRDIIHKELNSVSTAYVRYILNNPVQNTTIEFNDNRLSRYVAQNGKCYVTGQALHPKNIHCHHKIPRFMNGTDNYNNLLIVSKDIHILIHATLPQTINNYLNKLNLKKEEISKLNKLRLLVGNTTI